MLTMSAAMLVSYTACSDDSSGGSSTNPDTPTVPDTPQLPEVTLVSPVSPLPISVTVSGDGSRMVINGGATFDLLDTTTIPTGAEVAFTNAELSLAKVSETGAIIGTTLQITYTPIPAPIANVNWGDQGAMIIDDNKSDCGTFIIYATYMATYDASNPNMYVTRDSATFVRDQSFCEAIPETPTQTPEEIAAASIELVSAVINIGTKDGKGVSLSSAAAVDASTADIIFTADELTGKITMHTQNGFQITEYSNTRDKNYDDDWTISMLPPSPAHMSDFRFRKSNLVPTLALESYKFYVVIGNNYNEQTGDGFYAFTLQEKSDTADANGNYSLVLLLFKKK
jgi:hypothetical protein